MNNVYKKAQNNNIQEIIVQTKVLLELKLTLSLTVGCVWSGVWSPEPKPIVSHYPKYQTVGNVKMRTRTSFHSYSIYLIT